MNATLNLALPIPSEVCPDAPLVRMAGTPDDPLFSLTDICRVLSIANASDAASRLDDDEKCYIARADVGLSPGRDLVFVTEGGLYTLVIRSDKPEAKPFRKWVCGEVIPCIRKHGVYPPPAVAPAEDPVIAMLESIRAVRLAQIETERRVAEAREIAERAGRQAEAAMAVHSCNYGHYSVLAWCNLKGRPLTVAESSAHGKRLADICRREGRTIGRVSDPRFGQVNIYPEDVLANYFGREEG